MLIILDGDLNDFDKRMRGTKPRNDESSSEDEDNDPVDRKDPLSMMKEKNKILMDRLYKSEKHLEEMKQTYEAVISTSESLKDKKIIDLAKKNKALQI